MVRNRISAELHDDIGTKLTNINILSTLTNQAMQDTEKAKQLLKRISNEVQTSSEALDDIVWNINTKNDTLEEIIPRMRRYATEVLNGKKLRFNIQVPENIQHTKLSMEKRHDVYLLFKEMVNNIHKHANARQVLIEIEMRDSFFCLHVNDDGRGFDIDVPSGRNGLFNMKMRAERWKGKLTIESGFEKGTDIRVVLPLKKIHSNGV
jgi:signal transduction histidine kinase